MYQLNHDWLKLLKSIRYSNKKSSIITCLKSSSRAIMKLEKLRRGYTRVKEDIKDATEDVTRIQSQGFKINPIL